MSDTKAAESKLWQQGTLQLETPITARDEKLTELKYDFARLTGWEYIEAMDADADNTNMSRISHKQAFGLFAKAAAKANESVDETDLKQRMGVTDVINATRLGTAFFITTSVSARGNIKDA